MKLNYTKIHKRQNDRKPHYLRLLNSGLNSIYSREFLGKVKKKWKMRSQDQKNAFFFAYLGPVTSISTYQLAPSPGTYSTNLGSSSRPNSNFKSGCRPSIMNFISRKFSSYSRSARNLKLLYNSILLRSVQEKQ